MAVEKITDEQKSKEDECFANCVESQLQKAQQEAALAAKKAAQQLADAQQQLAKLPEDVMASLNQAIQQIMKVISGWENPKDPDFNPTKIINSLNSLLNPVIAALNALPVPTIPGLSDIAALLSKLMAMIPPSTGKSEDEIKKTIPKKPEIPPEFISTLEDLLTALSALCATLPMVLINLIFDMLNAIISMFDQIAGVIGVPSIPYPLNLVPKVISSMPQLTKCVLNLPVQLGITVKGILQKKLQEMAAMKFPEIPDIPESPDDGTTPSILPACPKRESSEGSKADLASK